jgi:hypothetical protein
VNQGRIHVYLLVEVITGKRLRRFEHEKKMPGKSAMKNPITVIRGKTKEGMTKERSMDGVET